MNTVETTEAPTEVLSVVVYRNAQEAMVERGALAAAPYGVLAEVQAGALVRSEESRAVLAEAQSLVVATPEDYKTALEIVRRAKIAGKTADEERTSYTAVINPVVKWINDQYRQAIADATAKDTGAAAIAWAKAQDYEAEQQRIANEAARKAREEQERAEKKLREEAEAKRVAEEQARAREEQARREAEEAAAAGDKAAQEQAEAEAEHARKEAERNAAAAERREEKAETIAAAPAFIPPATAGLRKGTGVGKGRKTYHFAFEDEGNPEACLLKIVKAAAAGNVAALRCLMVDPAGARVQSQAGATVPGLRFWEGSASPSVRR